MAPSVCMIQRSIVHHRCRHWKSPNYVAFWFTAHPERLEIARNPAPARLQPAPHSAAVAPVPVAEGPEQGPLLDGDDEPVQHREGDQRAQEGRPGPARQREAQQGEHVGQVERVAGEPEGPVGEQFGRFVNRIGRCGGAAQRAQHRADGERRRDDEGPAHQPEPTGQDHRPRPEPRRGDGRSAQAEQAQVGDVVVHGIPLHLNEHTERSPYDRAPCSYYLHAGLEDGSPDPWPDRLI